MELGLGEGIRVREGEVNKGGGDVLLLSLRLMKYSL